MRLLISGCLLGLRCRYDGACRPLTEETLEMLKEHFTLIPVCPEQLGGLATPREPSERVRDKVISRAGKDVTEEYQKGAKETLHLAVLFGCGAALLKEKSPSCGSGEIYDGSFQGKLVIGNGVTTELLQEHDIRVFGESRISDLLQWKEEHMG